MINPLSSAADLDSLIAASHTTPQFLLKHSTACAFSALANRTYARVSERLPGADFWRVLVLQDRSTSNRIADLTGIRHQSPQVILFHRGEAVWSTSHLAIRERALREALAGAGGIGQPA